MAAAGRAVESDAIDARDAQGLGVEVDIGEDSIVTHILDDVEIPCEKRDWKRIRVNFDDGCKCVLELQDHPDDGYVLYRLFDEESTIKVPYEMHKGTHYAHGTTPSFRHSWFLMKPILVLRPKVAFWYINASLGADIDNFGSRKFQTVFAPWSVSSHPALDGWRDYVMTYDEALAIVEHQSKLENLENPAVHGDVLHLLGEMQRKNCVIAANVHSSMKRPMEVHFTVRVADGGGATYHVYVIGCKPRSHRDGNRAFLSRNLAMKARFSCGIHISGVTPSD